MFLEGYVAYTHAPHLPPRDAVPGAFTVVRRARVRVRGASRAGRMQAIGADPSTRDGYAGPDSYERGPDSHPYAHPSTHVYSGARNGNAYAEADRYCHPGSSDIDTHVRSTDEHAHAHSDPHPDGNPYRYAHSHPQAVDRVQARQVAGGRGHRPRRLRQSGTH